MMKKKLSLSVVRLFQRFIKYLGSFCLLFNVCSIAAPVSGGLFTQEAIVDEPLEPSCSVSAPENGYEFSQLHASLFQSKSTTALPPMSQTWQVICSAPISALFLTIDADVQSNSLSDADPTHFGLGMVNGQGHLGYFQVTLDNATVDGRSVQLYQTTNQTSVTPAQSSFLLKPTAFYGWTQDGKVPEKGQQYSVNVTVFPTLYSLKETQGPLVDGAELDGELVLTFPFGI